MARRTWWSTWPWARRSHGCRSSVAKAKRSEFCAVTSGRRSSRFFAAVPSRIQIDMPRRTFSCASARDEALVVGLHAGADVGVQVEAREERRVAVDRHLPPPWRPPPSRGRRGRRRGSRGRSSSRRGPSRSGARRAARDRPVRASAPAVSRCVDGTHDGSMMKTSTGSPSEARWKARDPLDAADVRDLVRVGDDGRRSVGRREPRRTWTASSSSTRRGGGRPRGPERRRRP